MNIEQNNPMHPGAFIKRVYLMALKLSKVLGRSAESWLLMQDNYDLWQAKKVVDLNEYQALKFA
jgi:plasmid maintenance system antidote protein VapI